MKLLQLFIYYGMEKEALKRLDGNVVAHNFNMLKSVSFGCSMLMFIFSFSPLFIERDFGKTAVFVIFALLTLAIFIIIGKLDYTKITSSRLAYLLTSIVFILMILIGLYVSVFTNRERLAVAFMVILIGVQTLLIIPMYLRIALNAIAFAAFTVSVVLLKPPEIVVFELQNVVLTIVVAIMVGWHYSRVQCTEMTLKNLLEHKSMTDALTAIGNRRFFSDALEKYMTASVRMKTGGCIMMLDIDFFKEYNDHYGHPAGDAVLRQIGKILTDFSKRYGMTVSRIGGEEFAVLWSERRSEVVLSVALELLSAVESYNIPHEKSRVAKHVTISAGIYIITSNADENVDIVYQNADSALYEAKKTGRNRVVQYVGSMSNFRTVTREVIDQIEQQRRQARLEHDRK